MSVKLSLEASAFSSGLRLAINALGNFVKNAAAAQGKTSELNNSLKLIGAGAVITGVGVLLAKGLGDAASKAGDLQVVMKQIGMATGASAAQMDDFGKTFTNIGVKNQMSNLDAATVALAEIHAGITDPAKVKATVGTIANYAEVQQLSNHTDRKSAAETAASFAHAFGAYDPKTLNPLVNDLSKALTHAPTTGAGFLRLESQFTGATRNIYGGTQKDHLTMQHDDIMMGTLLAQMGQGTRGGTQFSSALMHMISTSAGRKGAAQLDQLGGGTFFNKDGTFKGDANLLKILSNASKKETNPIVMDNILKNAFGLTGERLMGMLSDPNSLKQFQNNEKTFARVPDIATQQSVLNATNQGQTQQLHKNIETLVILLGTTLLPTLVSITSAFVNLTKGAIQFATANPGIIKIVAAFAAVATAVALVVGPLLILAGAIGIVSIAMGALDAVSLPVVLVVLGIAAAVAAVVVIVTHMSDIVRLAVGVWDAFAQACRIVWEVVSRSPLTPFLALVLGPMVGVVLALVAAFKLLPTVLALIASIAAKLAGPLKAVSDAAGGVLKGAASVLGGAAGAAGKTAGTFLNWAAVDNADNPFIKHAVKPGHGHGGGGGPGDSHVTINQQIHLHGSDIQTQKQLADIVAKHTLAVVNNAQGRDLNRQTNSGALSHRGLVPRYQ
jgi:hypothetical protein